MQRKLKTTQKKGKRKKKKERKEKNHITISRIKIWYHLIIKLSVCESLSHLFYRQDKNNTTQSR